MPTLFTIGHSTHPFEEFVRLLDLHRIDALADIRRFPGSRKHPQFNSDVLSKTLPGQGVDYRWFEALGGRRPSSGKPSKNLGLRNESFRNYADYMATPEFQAALDELLDLAGQKRTAFMCSESVFWRCHRRLVSDFLLAHGHTVQHIMPTGDLRPHIMSEGAKVKSGELTYPLRGDNERRSLFDDE